MMDVSYRSEDNDEDKERSMLLYFSFAEFSGRVGPVPPVSFTRCRVEPIIYLPDPVDNNSKTGTGRTRGSKTEAKARESVCVGRSGFFPSQLP